MKIIILAAGKGTRLGPLTENTPKPLVDMGGGRTLLEFQLKQMEESGVIDEIIVVAGYLARHVEEKVRTFKTDIPVRVVYNPFYDVSNNLMSLWFATPEMQEDFIITNGDNLFEANVYRKLAGADEDGIYLTTVKKEKFDEDDMKVTLKEGAFIKRVSKKIPLEETDAESVGLVLVKGKLHRRLYADKLKELAYDPAFLNVFWLETFNELERAGIDTRTFDMTGMRWQEVDFHMDVDLARLLVKEKAKLVEDDDAS